MSSKVEFQILYGATQHEPLSYMLSLDGFNILLDCGWTDAMDVSVLEPLKRYGALHPSRGTHLLILELAALLRP